MKTAVIFSIVLAFASASSLLNLPSFMDYGVSRASTTCAQSNTQGLICTGSCGNLTYCLKDANGWTEILIQSCSPPYSYCNLVTKKCDLAAGYCTDGNVGNTFQCTGSGVYPDPYDCQKYHACPGVGQTSIAMDCPGSTSLNPKDNTCSNSLDATNCKVPPYTCQNMMDDGAWPGNDNVYYVCLPDANGNMAPRVFRCPANQAYINHSCSVAVATTTSAPVVCHGNGNIRDPANCYKYYSCGHSQVPKPHSCDPGFYYNRNTQCCKRGSCPY